MFKKCKANCQANDNLYLRGDVFYYMVELPRQNGKRRYFIKSLHTKNYYEARTSLCVLLYRNTHRNCFTRSDSRDTYHQLPTPAKTPERKSESSWTSKPQMLAQVNAQSPASPRSLPNTQRDTAGNVILHQQY